MVYNSFRQEKNMIVYYQLDSDNKVIHAMEAPDGNAPDISGTDWVQASGVDSAGDILGLTYNSESGTFA